MAENYKEGDKYYLPVVVDEIDEDADYALNLRFIDGRSGDYARVMDKPNLLLTADEIADAKYEEIRKRYERALNDVAELGGEIKTLKFENERLSKQNEELGTKVNDLEAELQNAQKSIDYNNKMEKSRTRLVDGQTMTIYRKDKTINILIDKIVSLEMMLDEEREKHNG